MRSAAAKISAAGVSTLVGASAFAGVGMLAAPTASAAPGCTSPTSGVTVVVQFTTGTAIGCAPGSPASALDALRSAGFSTTGTAGFGDSFLCSINGKPIATMCPRPPKDIYWTVFWAKRGGSWNYSQQGVTTLHVPAGGVVGFKYGNGGAPTVAVPAVFPSAPSKTVTPPAKPAPSHPAPHSASSSAKAPAKPATSAASKAPAAPASKAPTQTPHAAAKQTTSQTHATSAASAKPSASSTGASTATPTSSAAAVASSSSAPVVKATQTVHEGNATKVVVTYNDGSKATVAPSAAASGQYKVGATKSAQPTSMAKSSTQVPTPGNTSHPSIWTSGSVPEVPQAASKGGSNNLPGILAGAGVVGALAAGGVYAARRRG